jgi:hypothetical protein
MSSGLFFCFRNQALEKLLHVFSCKCRKPFAQYVEDNVLCDWVIGSIDPFEDNPILKFVRASHGKQSFLFPSHILEHCSISLFELLAVSSRDKLRGSRRKIRRGRSPSCCRTGTSFPFRGSGPRPSFRACYP